MRLTHLADYAVVMMTAAARRDAMRAPVSATELGEETGVPLPTAQKLMQQLAAPACCRAARRRRRLALARPASESAWPTSSRRSKGRSR